MSFYNIRSNKRLWSIWGQQVFCVFLKEVSSAHQGTIYLIKNTVKQ